jgi:hypothetical protein
MMFGAHEVYGENAVSDHLVLLIFAFTLDPFQIPKLKPYERAWRFRSHHGACRNNPTSTLEIGVVRQVHQGPYRAVVNGQPDAPMSITNWQNRQAHLPQGAPQEE